MIINELERMIEAGEIKGSSEALDDSFSKRKEASEAVDPMRRGEAPLVSGARVILRENMPPTYTVIKIEGGKAVCVPSGGTGRLVFDLSALIRIQ